MIIADWVRKRAMSLNCFLALHCVSLFFFSSQVFFFHLRYLLRSWSWSFMGCRNRKTSTMTALSILSSTSSQIAKTLPILKYFKMHWHCTLLVWTDHFLFNPTTETLLFSFSVVILTETWTEMHDHPERSNSALKQTQNSHTHLFIGF